MTVRLAIAVISITLLGSSAQAKEPVYAFGKRPVHSSLGGSHLGAHFLDDVDDYTEYWSHAFLFKSGHVLFARYLITNLGPGDNKGAVAGHLIAPDGSVYSFTDGRRDRSWSYSKGKLRFSLAKHSLSGDGKSFQLKLGNDKGEKVSLTFTNEIDGYRPGRVLYGKHKEGFLDFSVTSPFAKATGTFTGGGSTVELEGYGYADHFYTNYAQHNQCTSWITFAGFADDLVLNLTTVQTTKRFGRKRFSYLALGEGGALKLTGNWVRLSRARFFKDRKSTAKYRVPRLLRFSYRDKKSGDWLKVRVSVKKRLHRFDVLKGLAAFERFVVERFAKPMQYRMLAKFSVRGKVGGKKISKKGEGLVEVIRLN